jgi:hypothetical protein
MAFEAGQAKKGANVGGIVGENCCAAFHKVTARQRAAYTKLRINALGLFQRSINQCYEKEILVMGKKRHLLFG